MAPARLRPWHRWALLFCLAALGRPGLGSLPWGAMVVAPAPPALPVRVGPSVLAGDLAMLATETRRALRAGADFVHLDVFDGNWIKVWLLVTGNHG